MPLYLAGMFLLPIADRELRVASRKGSTFWVRLTGALVAVVIGGGFIIVATFSFRFGADMMGRGLFATLTWLALGAALLAGLFLTSDCLSEEKREGTLGLLFLTDLRGYDVISGKLLASSLRGFYALLAAFPVLAITLLMGGIGGAQFWRTCLALVTALLVSLAAGLFVSVVSRDSQRALSGTLLLVVALAAAGPAIDGILAAIARRPFSPVLSLASPVYLFITAGAWGTTPFTPFWWALLANQTVAWTLFGLTCFLLPRTWQDKPMTRAGARGWTQWWKFGGAKRRVRLRQKLLGHNPVSWLACRERWQAVLLWTVILALMGAVGVTLAVTDQPAALWFTWSYFAGVFVFVLYLGMASQAGRFLVETRRSGLLELLLATPVTVQQIVRGQWRALARLFAAPVLLWLALHLVGAFFQQRAWNSLMAAGMTPATTTTNTMVGTNTTVVTNTTAAGPTTVSVSVSGRLGAPGDGTALAVSLGKVATVLANLVALVWFGMWMGLTSRTANLSTLKTILFVQVIPWFVISFASMMSVPLLLLPALARGTGAQFAFWYPLLTAGIAILLSLVKDIGFIGWSRRKLYSEFRHRAALALRSPRPGPMTK